LRSHAKQLAREIQTASRRDTPILRAVIKYMSLIGWGESPEKLPLLDQAFLLLADALLQGKADE